MKTGENRLIYVEMGFSYCNLILSLSHRIYFKKKYNYFWAKRKDRNILFPRMNTLYQNFENYHFIIQKPTNTSFLSFTSRQYVCDVFSNCFFFFNSVLFRLVYFIICQLKTKISSLRINEIYMSPVCKSLFYRIGTSPISVLR